MSNVLSFDEQMAVQDTDYTSVPVPEWGKDKVVQLASVSALEMLEFLEKTEGQTQREKSFGLVALSLISNDERLNEDQRIAYVAFLKKRRLGVVDRIATAAKLLNGFGRMAHAKNDSGEAVPTTAASPSS